MRVLGFGVAFLDFRGEFCVFGFFSVFIFGFIGIFGLQFLVFFVRQLWSGPGNFTKKIEIVVFLDTLLIFEHLARQLWERPATLQKKKMINK